ncbi:hypothetical protein FQN49_004785 [Arthroderma sp. PD_2]|nr:hypothetical protein FQN49_004785 [Arthroderma sp. PD_2]
MGGKQGIVPIVIAVGFGILNGKCYMVFKPAYDEREAQKIMEPAYEANILLQLIGSNANVLTSPKQSEPTYTRQIYSWWTGNDSTDKAEQHK